MRSAARADPMAIATGVVVVATTLLYVGIIAAQGDGLTTRVVAVVALLVATIACVMATIIVDDVTVRGVVGSAAAGALLSLGVLALLSIGLLLLVAGIVMVAWLARTREERRGVPWLPSVVAFTIGAAIPWILIVAP